MKFEKIPCLMQIRSREFNLYDRLYWGDYCISKETLEAFGVKPITHYWINGTRYPAHKVAYAYCEHPGKYKLYSPLKQDGKWFGNMQVNHVQGITICIPTELGVKDISDVMQVHGPIKAISIIKWHSKGKVEGKA